METRNIFKNVIKTFFHGIAAVLLSLAIGISFCGAGVSVSDFEYDFGDWYNAGGDDFDWITINRPTPSSYTGPAKAYKGSFYAYIEASYPNYPCKTGYLESKDITELSEQAPTEITFYYHMYGSNIGTLSLEYYDGAAWVNIWEKKGEQHSGYNAAWAKAEIDLTDKIIKKMRFKGETGATPAGDIAIDEVAIQFGEPAQPPITEEKDPVFKAWDKSDGISIKESQISDFKLYLTKETDPLFAAWDKNYEDLINKPDLSGFLKAELDPKIGSLIANKWCTSDGSKINCAADMPSLWSANAGSIYYNGGNVGIGTANPTEKLEVAGTVKADNFVKSDGSEVCREKIDGPFYNVSGGTGPFCIFANTCPTGWIEKGRVGFIMQGSCPYGQGAYYGSGWYWCHPSICCKD